MSDAVSALNGVSYQGYCTVSDAGLTGMITVRGDLTSRRFGAALKKATGCTVPGQGAIVAKGGIRVAWMSPDELMIFAPYEEATGLTSALTDGQAEEHALVVNVSDARVVLRVEGLACREVMAKLTPADVSPQAFGPGQMRRTRLQQAAAAFFMPDGESFEVIAFRSMAAYVFELLSTAAREGGEVEVF